VRFYLHDHPWCDNEELVSALYESCCRRDLLLGQTVSALYDLMDRQGLVAWGSGTLRVARATTVFDSCTSDFPDGFVLVIPSVQNLRVFRWTQNFPAEGSWFQARVIPVVFADWYKKAREADLSEVPDRYFRYRDRRDEGHALDFEIVSLPYGSPTRVVLDGMPDIRRDDHFLVRQALTNLREALGLPDPPIGSPG